MVTAKAVVLARGLGTRMREDDASTPMDAAQAAAAARGLKAMMPVAIGPPAPSSSGIAAPGTATAGAEPSVSATLDAWTADAADAGDAAQAVQIVRSAGSASAALGSATQEAAAPGAATPDAAMPDAAQAAAPRPRPFLDYILSALADAGYTDVCLVIAPDHDRVRDYYTREAPPRRLRVTFAVQAEPRGTADALLAAEAFAAADDVIVINGDNYYPVAALRALRELDGPGTVLFTPDGLVRRGNIAPERLRAFAVGALDEDDRLADIVEKPDEETMRAMGGEALISMNCWRVPAAIYDICRQVQPSPRGELELSLAIRDAVRRHGVRFQVLRSDDGVLDLSRRADIASVAAHLRGVVVHP